MDESTASDSAVYAAREIRVVFSRIRRRLKDASDNRELTPSQTSVLSRLSKEGPASMSALAAAERVRPQSMAATLAPSTSAASPTAAPTRTTAAASSSPSAKPAVSSSRASAAPERNGSCAPLTNDCPSGNAGR